jgi:imidazoleglycerol phosphate dehydratase HisB
MQDEYLSRCVVDPIKRTVYLYSNEGSEKQVTCDTVDEFMNVLQWMRKHSHTQIHFKIHFWGKNFPGKKCLYYFFEKHDL